MGGAMVHQPPRRHGRDHDTWPVVPYTRYCHRRQREYMDFLPFFYTTPDTCSMVLQGPHNLNMTVEHPHGVRLQRPCELWG